MKEDGTGRETNFYASLSKLSAIITILPASMAGGWIMGHYLVDRLFGSGPWGGIACLFVGAGAGFYEIARLLTKVKESNTETPRHDGD